MTLCETVGYGDQINKEDSFKSIVDYIDNQFESYLQEELKIKRNLARLVISSGRILERGIGILTSHPFRIPLTICPKSVSFHDTRIHACLYFITPNGHGLKSLDLVCMKKLDSKVNIIPVIAKADTVNKQVGKEVVTQPMLVDPLIISHCGTHVSDVTREIRETRQHRSPNKSCHHLRICLVPFHFLCYSPRLSQQNFVIEFSLLQELATFKSKVMSELLNNNVQIYQFPVSDETIAETNKTMNSHLPFAIVGSNDFVKVRIYLKSSN